MRQNKIARQIRLSVAVREIAEAPDRARASKQITLHLIAKLVLQELKFGVSLDAFRRRTPPKD